MQLPCSARTLSVAALTFFAPFTAWAAPILSVVDLFGAGDFSQCREPLGDWAMADDVALMPGDDTHLVWTDGKAAVVNGAKGKTVNMHSVAEHGDVQLHVEFLVARGSNSGVYLMGRYEIQVLDSWGKTELKYSDCGGIYQRHDPETNAGFEGHAPRVNASKAPGEWQTFDIAFRAPRFDAEGNKTHDAVFEKVLLNGVVIHENVPVTGPTRSGTWKDEKPFGPIMFQGNHGPVGYRNVRLEPLK